MTFSKKQAPVATTRRQLFDLRAEALAAALLRSGDWKPGRWKAVFKGEAQRGYWQDVPGIHPPTSRPGAAHLMWVNRPGLYDQLPKAFFSDPDCPGSNAEKEEATCRLFFAGLEQAMFETGVAIAQASSDGAAIAEALRRFWRVDDLPEALAQRLLWALPQVKTATGDWVRCGAIFSAVLQRQVEFSPVAPQPLKVPEDVRWQTDTALLCKGTIPCSTFRHFTPGIRVAVEVKGAADANAWLREALTLRLLTRLCDVFLPFEADVTLALIDSSNPALPLQKWERPIAELL